MSEIFLRHARLTLSGAGGSIVVNRDAPATPDSRQLAVRFHVERTITSEPNTADVEVVGLSEKHREALGREFDSFALEAGYGANAGLIFAGSIRDIRHARDGASLVTSFQCGDGDAALRRATLARAFPPGTDVDAVVDALAGALASQGIAQGERQTVGQAKPGEYVVCGPVASELNRLGASHGFYWSIQNGALEVINGDDALADITHITPSSGLVGVPTFTDRGLELVTTLNPALRPGRRVAVSSRYANLDRAGYRIARATFTGDNRDGRFETKVLAEPAGGNGVDPGRARRRAGALAG